MEDGDDPLAVGSANIRIADETAPGEHASHAYGARRSPHAAPSGSGAIDLAQRIGVAGQLPCRRMPAAS